MLKKWVKMSFPDHGVNRKVVDNVENYQNMKFQPKLMTRSRENGQKPHFLTYFLIWLPSICKNRHTVFTKVVDNDPSNLYMNFQPNLATRSRENVQKPQKTSKSNLETKTRFGENQDFLWKIRLYHFFTLMSLKLHVKKLRNSMSRYPEKWKTVNPLFWT